MRKTISLFPSDTLKFTSRISIITVVGCLMLQPVIAQESVKSWQPWKATKAATMTLPASPDAAATAEELKVITAIQSELSVADHESIAYWSPGAPNYRWNQMLLDIYAKGPPSPFKGRGLALMNVAIYDAVAIATNAKSEFNRARPIGADILTAMPQSSSYPSSRAAAAGAAAGVLAYLFPDDAAKFMQAAEHAAQSRVMAGVNFPSDIEAGIDIGEAVARELVAFAKTDNSDAEWNGKRPTGADKLKGDVFVYPAAGQWTPWAMKSADHYLPPPPYAIDSAEMAADLNELKNIERNIPTSIAAWLNHSIDRAYRWWYDRLATAMFESGSDISGPGAALAYATVAAANHDAILACFNAKYTYWMIRPAQLDNSLTTLFPNPPHPSYPAAHSCSPTSFAVSIGHFYPAHSESLMKAADVAGYSRIIAGIHYPNDKRAGEQVGTDVTLDVIAFSETLGTP